MKILHLSGTYDNCDNIITAAESAGFGPASFVAEPASVSHNLNCKDVEAALKTEFDRFFAYKVTLRKGMMEHEAVQSSAFLLASKVIEQYRVQEELPDWDGKYELEIIPVIRYGVGGFFRIHQDMVEHPEEGKYKGLNILVYLSDFEGGELIFHGENACTIKPKKGDVVIFPSGKNFKHSANKVTQGVKYVMTLRTIVTKQLDITK